VKIYLFKLADLGEQRSFAEIRPIKMMGYIRKGWPMETS
jgi:hypothetical protein